MVSRMDLKMILVILQANVVCIKPGLEPLEALRSNPAYIRSRTILVPCKYGYMVPIWDK